jgi:tagatose 1,6-diphosphate aldolase
MKISAGKWRGLQAVSDDRGVIAAAAVDQRKTLRQMIAEERGILPVAVQAEDLRSFKEAVAKVLSPHASALLLDPEFGLSAAQNRAKNCGLIYAYENSEYDKLRPGRLPSLIPGFSVRRLAALGADSIKILLYYSPSDSPEINNKKCAWVERVGIECSETQLPFFLELLCYENELPEKSMLFARKKPSLLFQSVQEFSQSRYAVDILKIDAPVNMIYVEGARASAGESVYSREEAKDHFRHLNEVAGRPFVFLSAGVTNDTFKEALELAAEAGCGFCGFLCGRAIWQGGVAAYMRHGRPALEEWLLEVGVPNFQSVHERLKSAKPWFSFYGATSSAELRG